jgi:hypothetical protein
VFSSWGCGNFSEVGWILRADGTFSSSKADGGETWNLMGSVFHLPFDYHPHTA